MNNNAYIAEQIAYRFKQSLSINVKDLVLVALGTANTLCSWKVRVTPSAITHYIIGKTIYFYRYYLDDDESISLITGTQENKKSLA